MLIWQRNLLFASHPTSWMTGSLGEADMSSISLPSTTIQSTGSATLYSCMRMLWQCYPPSARCSCWSLSHRGISGCNQGGQASSSLSHPYTLPTWKPGYPTHLDLWLLEGDRVGSIIPNTVEDCLSMVAITFRINSNCRPLWRCLNGTLIFPLVWQQCFCQRHYLSPLRMLSRILPLLLSHWSYAWTYFNPSSRPSLFESPSESPSVCVESKVMDPSHCQGHSHPL